MTDFEKPAAHVLVSTSTGEEYDAVTAHIPRKRLVNWVKGTVVVAFGVPLVWVLLADGVKKSGWVSMTVGLLLMGSVIVGLLWAANSETYKAARRGYWSRSCLVVVEAAGEVTFTPGYLVLRRSGVHVERVWTERVTVRFRTVHTFPWSSLTAIELTPGARRWRSVVLSGPGVRIAPVGPVNQGFVEALEKLGARTGGVQTAQ